MSTCCLKFGLKFKGTLRQYLVAALYLQYIGPRRQVSGWPGVELPECPGGSGGRFPSYFSHCVQQLKPNGRRVFQFELYPNTIICAGRVRAEQARGFLPCRRRCRLVTEYTASAGARPPGRAADVGVFNRFQPILLGAERKQVQEGGQRDKSLFYHGLYLLVKQHDKNRRIARDRKAKWEERREKRGERWEGASGAG